MMQTSKALEVRVQQYFAQPQPVFGRTMGEVSQQSGFQPVLRRKLMAALSMTGRELGLRPASLMVLDTLLSFLPCTDAAGKEMPVTPLHLLTIYASNDTISFRARGLTDRQLRRHFDLLERQGLIQRRDSANGKRFPIYQNGKVIGAYGIDLMPLFARADALLTRAAKLRDEKHELRGVKAQIGQLRATLLAQSSALPHVAIQFIEQLRNLTRRVGLTLIEAKALLQRLNAFLNVEPRAVSQIEPANVQSLNQSAQETPAIFTNETPACAGQNVRHNKPKNTYTKKSSFTEEFRTEDHITLWSKLTSLADFFPDHPKTIAELTSILGQAADILRIDKALYHRAVSSLHPLQFAQILNRILGNHHNIRQPDAYLHKVLRAELSYS